jgi:acyl-CoA thioester hydrolase
VEHLTDWDYPSPFIIEREVQSAHIDGLGHTNNVVYLQWIEDIAWAHSVALGISLEDFRRLNRAMVARRHEINYLASSFLGDRIIVATWLTGNDKKLSIWRHYQMIGLTDGKTLLRASTHWVCVDFATGAPKRMPQEFVSGYQPTAPATLQRNTD